MAIMVGADMLGPEIGAPVSIIIGADQGAALTLLAGGSEKQILDSAIE